MAFVKVVGGIEIYNFRIQSFVHFYTYFWSYLISNSGLAKCSVQGTDAPRHRARPRDGRPWRPRHAQPQAPPTEAAASLGIRTLMCLVFSCARVASPSRRTHVPAVRASVETPPYHGGIFVVSTPSPPSAYLRSLSFLVCAMPSCPTLVVSPAMDVVAAEH
jgi:hypothetical protein